MSLSLNVEKVNKTGYQKRTRGQPDIFKDRVVKVEPLDTMEVQEGEHWSQTGGANVEMIGMGKRYLGSRTPFSIWKSSIAFNGSVQLVSASLNISNLFP